MLQVFEMTSYQHLSNDPRKDNLIPNEYFKESQIINVISSKQ